MGKFYAIKAWLASVSPHPARVAKRYFASRKTKTAGEQNYLKLLGGEQDLYAAEDVCFETGWARKPMKDYQKAVMKFVKGCNALAREADSPLAQHVRDLAWFWKSRLNTHKRALELERLEHGA